MKSLVAIVAGMILAFSTSLPAQAFKPTYAIKACQETGFRPRSITVAQPCWADAGIYARVRAWRFWDRAAGHDRHAKAAGRVRQDDCRPDCASGHFHRRAAEILLTRRGWCPSVHRFVYRRQHIKYVGPDIGRGRPVARWPHGWQWLGCP